MLSGDLFNRYDNLCVALSAGEGGALMEEALLTIRYGDMEGSIYSTSMCFNNANSSELFKDPFAQHIIE